MKRPIFSSKPNCDIHVTTSCNYFSSWRFAAPFFPDGIGKTENGAFLVSYRKRSNHEETFLDAVFGLVGIRRAPC